MHNMILSDNEKLFIEDKKKLTTWFSPEYTVSMYEIIRLNPLNLYN